MQGAFVARIVFLAVAAVAAAAEKPSPAEMPQHDETCMACLCKAVGKNGMCVSDMRLKCVHQDTHGPFCISLPFWIDAGKPVLPGDNKDLPGAFLRCVEEPFCAVRTIRGYMETGPGIQDCDKNGIYNCRDLILTHLHGRYNCKNSEDRRVTMLEKCMQEARPQPARPGGSPPRGGTPLNAYGRGAVGTGWGNPFSAASASASASGKPFGAVGSARNTPRDTFNALQGSVPSWERVGLNTDDNDHVDGHSTDPFNGVNRMHQLALEHAARMAQDAARNAEFGMPHRNTLPFPYDDENRGTS